MDFLTYLKQNKTSTKPTVTIPSVPSGPSSKKPLGGATISADTSKNLYNSPLYKFLPKTVREALFGTGVEYSPEAQDKGFLNFLMPFITRSQQTQYDVRRESGISPDVAMRDITGEKQTSITPEEKSSLMWQNAGESLGKTLDLPIFTGIGGLKNVAKDEIVSIARKLVTVSDHAGIQTTLRPLGLSDDATRELADGIKMINTETKMTQGKRSIEIQNLIDDVMKKSRAVPEGPARSVVQVVDTKTGKNVFYTVSPEDLKALSTDVIDGTTRGVAGKTIDGKIYHLTAKTPTQMLERAGWKNGGEKTIGEITSMITPKRRVAVRTEDGRFAGSFMEEDSAYKLAQKYHTDSALIDEAKRFDTIDAFIKAQEKKIGVKRGEGDLIKVTNKTTGKSEERIVISKKEDGSLVTTTKDVYFPTRVSNEKFTVEQLGRKAKLPDGGITFGDLEKFDASRGSFENAWNIAHGGSAQRIARGDTYDITQSEARAIIDRLFTKDEVSFMFADELIDGKAVGKFSRKQFRDLIEVVTQNGKVQSSTVYHEAFHKYFNTFLPKEQRREMLDKVIDTVLTGKREIVYSRDTYKTADARAEEWLADDFANYIKETSQNKVPTSIFSKIWRGVMAHIRKLIRKANQFDSVYDDILAKKRTGFVERAPLRTSKFKMGDFSKKPEEFYDQVLTQFAGAEKGERIGVQNADGTFGGYRAKKSSFPEWVPQDLRSRELFDKYLDGRDGTLNDFNIRYKEGSKLARLDNAMREAIQKETGMDLTIPPDDLSYLDNMAAQYNNEIDDLTGDLRNDTLRTPDPLGHAGTQTQKTGEQGLQSVSKVGTSDLVYPTETKKAIQKVAQDTGISEEGIVKRFEGLRRIKTWFVEAVQNSDERVRQLMNRKDLLVSDDSNIYQKATLYSGKVGTLIEEARTEAKTILEDIRDAAKSMGTDFDALRGEIDDYLIARHAPERNAVLGDGAAGMKTAEAEMLKSKIESGPRGEEVKRIANTIQKMNDRILDLLKDSQVITPELHETLRTRYKNHVPLYRISETENDIGGLLTGKGFDVRSTGIKKAKGSDREIDDVIGNIMYNYEQAILRAEKNTVDLATLQFVRDNKKALGGLMSEKSPEVIGTMSDGTPIFKQITDPRYLQLRENGKIRLIKIEDPNLAVAIRGVGREKLGTLMNWIGTFTRFYSGLHTRFNPDFALPNKIRDLQETITYLASQKDIGGKGAFRMTLRDPKSTKDVLDFIRGKDTEGARLYREMKEAGGTTGGFGLSTRKQVGLDIKALEKLVNSKTRRVTENIVEYVDYWNTIFEDSTRLSVYKEARAQGLSKDRAAFLAKEASINFNRMGKGGPVINAMWMFSNASIQGSTKMLRALKDPKVLAGVTLTVGTSVAAINEWNDRVDPQWREKVPKWDRLNSLPVILPREDGSFHYIAIPVSWGIKPIKVMIDYAHDALSGHGKSAKEITSGVFTSILEAYNPAGGTDLISAITPTFLDTPFEIGRNMSWTGSKIRPINYNNAPDDTLYFPSIMETTTGKTAVSISEMLAKGGIEISPASMKYAYEQYVGGAGRFVNRMFNAVAGAITKDPVALDEYPFIARFYRERGPDELDATKSTETDALQGLMDEDARAKKKLNIEAIKLKEEVMSLTTSDAKKARMKEIAKENPDLAKKVLDMVEDEKAGLTPQESQLKGATVKVRAEYIKGQLSKMTTAEEKKAYLKDLKSKKILTESVLDELGF